MKTEENLKSYYQGKVINSYPEFFQSPAFLQNKLPEEQKRLWVSVLEKYYSKGDMVYTSEQTAISMLQVIQSLKISIQEESELLFIKDENGKETIPQKKVVGYYLSNNKEDEVDFGLMEDADKRRLFAMLRNDNAIQLHIEWSLVHFGMKAAMYFGAVENLKQTILETQRPLFGNSEKREARMVSRNDLILKSQKVYEMIEQLRFELFAITEEEEIGIIKTTQEGFARRVQAMKQKLKAHG